LGIGTGKYFLYGIPFCSLQLNGAYVLLLPEWCVEHVVVHELCHLLEPSHNARFHALMDKFFPRWKEARKETRQICKMEEDEDDGD